MRAAVESKSTEAELLAPVAWKVDSERLKPAAKKEQPRTRRTLDRMLPSMLEKEADQLYVHRIDSSVDYLVWTMRSSPLTRARIPTMAGAR